MARPRVFLLDNLDSFTFNVAQQIARLGAEVIVRRAPAASPAEVRAMQPTHLVLSPGPLHPKDHPRNAELLQAFAGALPMLGICLGMQAMNCYFGGTVRCDQPPMHGKTSAIHHHGTGLFEGVPNPFVVARYHSLVLDRVGAGFTMTAETSDHRPMAIAHQTMPLCGVQFHPESFLTVDGDRLIANFLEHSLC